MADVIDIQTNLGVAETRSMMMMMRWEISKPRGSLNYSRQSRPISLSPTMPTEGQKFFQGDSFARSILANDPTLHMHTVFLNSV